MCRCSSEADDPRGDGQSADVSKPADGPVLMRPHHGMCLAYFIGKGYNAGFSVHMERMLALLLTDVPVRLTVSTDRICGACPNNHGGVCASWGKVEKYDQNVLKSCSLKEGQILSFVEFVRKVQKNVIDCGKREKICGGCQWSDICDHQKSRWENFIQKG